MGTSQSTQRAAKFSGNHRRSVRITYSAPSSAVPLRRTASTNTGRNVKEFSKFWTSGGSFQPRGSQRGKRERASLRENSKRGNRTQSVDTHSSQSSPHYAGTPLATPRSPLIVRTLTRNGNGTVDGSSTPTGSLSIGGSDFCNGYSTPSNNLSRTYSTGLPELAPGYQPPKDSSQQPRSECHWSGERSGVDGIETAIF